MESVATPGEQPPADPITERYLQERALFLEDWAKTVQPNQDALEAYLGHALTYGSNALQASYILNGGALAALPALLSALSGATIAQIATAAIPFVVGRRNPARLSHPTIQTHEVMPPARLDQ